MEGGLISSTPERPNARCTHLNPTKNNASDCVSRPGKHYSIGQNNIWTGLLAPAPTLLVNSYQHRQQQQKRPPLLPLPITRPYNSLPTRTMSTLSCSPTKKKINTNMKKTKPSTTSPKKEDPKTDFVSRTRTNTDVSKFLTTAPTMPLGPDPNDLPKNVSRVLSSSTELPKDHNDLPCTVLDLEKFTNSIYSLSPHPSSLPLPKFSLRPKLGCKSKVSGISSGATENLRRLLRLP